MEQNYLHGKKSSQINAFLAATGWNLKKMMRKLKLEIAVNAGYLESCVKAISNAAKTGNIGDGKIFVMDLEECVRIRTGEKGTKAIG